MLLCMRFESHHTMFQSLDARVFGDVQGFIVAIPTSPSRMIPAFRTILP